MNTKNYVIQQALNNYNSKIVEVKKENISNIKLFIKDYPSQLPLNPLFEKMSNQEAVRYILALNSINYQFWDLNDKGEFIRYSFNNEVGANALFNNFFNFYSKFNLPAQEQLIDEDVLKKHFGNLPQIESRVSILRESMANSKFKCVWDLIIGAINEKNTIDTQLAYDISLIYQLSYTDSYLKKIQLALYDVFNVLKKKKPDLKLDLTIAADYQIPKVLEGLGILKYSEALENKVKNGELIEPDSEDENAIRSASILACNLIVKEHNISVPVLDKQLWLIRNDFKDKRFHLSKTTKY